jgi:hypothetical protein
MEKAEAAHESVSRFRAFVGSPRAPPHKNLLPTRIDTQVRVYSERRAGTVPYSAHTSRHTCARSTGPAVACVVLTFTRMRTDQPLRRTVDGGLTHRRGSQGSGSPTNPPPPTRPDMCARVRTQNPEKHILHDILTHHLRPLNRHTSHSAFTHAAFTTWILCAPRPKFNPVVP